MANNKEPYGVDQKTYAHAYGNYMSGNKDSYGKKLTNIYAQKYANQFKDTNEAQYNRFKVAEKNRKAYENQSGGRTIAPSGMDMTSPDVGEQYQHYNQDKYNETPGGDWINQHLDNTFSNPGTYEDFYEQISPKFSQPGTGQQYWNQHAGKFNEFGNYNGPNNAQAAFNYMQSNMPGSVQPTFDAAYDRAKETAVSDFNNQAASRGAYGSSAALSGLGGVIKDIEAARADRASDFALQDSANQRAWGMGLGQLGRSADLSGMDMHRLNQDGILAGLDAALSLDRNNLSRDQFAAGLAQDAQIFEQDRIRSGADLAFTASDESLQRLLAGQNAATTAQNLRNNRVQGAFNNQMSYLNTILPFISGSYADIIGADNQAQSNIWNTKLGNAVQAFQSQSDTDARVRNSNEQIGRLIASLYTGGAGGAVAGAAANRDPADG